MELSFIKFTKNEHNLDLKMIDSIDLRQYSGSNDECLDESIVIAIKSIHNQELDKHSIILATNRGVVINIDITHFIFKYFKANRISLPKESVNILRNQRE